MPVPPAAVPVFGAENEAISRYVDILLSIGVERGLLGPREVDRIWERHILNSVALLGLVPEGSAVVDVGSGAGLPGLPLAIARPDLQVTLVEPLLRRSVFLTEAVAALGLADRVRVVRSRAEDLHESFDVVTARAVAPLDRLVSWCEPLRRRDGWLLALKGQSAADEIRRAHSLLDRLDLTAELLSVRASADAEPTTAVRVGRRY
jgi:16S rRNA (guanine527-N7)-methyltransferase